MAWLISLMLAVGVSGAQTWLKLVSREPPPGKKHALTMDDAVFWIDWTVTAVVALCGSLIVASLDHKPIATTTVVVALGAILVGMTIMPFGVRLICYDGSGGIKGWVHVVCANAFGLIVLMSAVAAGVKIYG
ncbi:hypothetical protein [Streptomyces sviceus]|uniref:hypothetical protein n=1 Tax=Streptomyces sviceus TaxID=285530 RepID=UPI0036EB1320